MKPLARNINLVKIFSQGARIQDYANFNGNAVYYRGRNNTNADYGLFYLNNTNAANTNGNIGSRQLSQTKTRQLERVHPYHLVKNYLVKGTV